MMKRIITISREFGSGGRSIGKAVAKKLGYQYYDKELIERISEVSGFSKEYIEEKGEYSPNSTFGYAFVGRTINGLSAEDYLWEKQREVILKIAEKENCVIVGRCADYILRDKEECLNIFIHADMRKRAERIVNLYGETTQEPEKRLREKDRKRQVNYKYYTDRQWGLAKNYHITLDSGELGLERCEDMIVDIVKNS